jgi:hypothetical protein
MMIKKILFSTLFLVSITAVFGQFTDDFDDLDYTNNPTWTVSQGIYIVAPTINPVGGELQQVDIAANTSSISTPSAAACNAVWEFSVRNEFNPSLGNNSSIYFMSDKADLTANDINGYFIKVGGIAGNDDSLELYKSVNGSTTKILGGTKGAVGTSPNLRIKITRDANGQFELLADYTNGTNFVSQGKVTDIAVTASNFFGFKNEYTITRASSFFFDDISVTGEACNIIIQEGGLKITRIIAQACGEPESQNELTKFRVGPKNLNTTNLKMFFPSGPKNTTLRRDAGTAAKVANMNSQISGACAGKDLFIEPIGGILPANSEVLLLSSYLFDESAWNFGELKDTIYVIFQDYDGSGTPNFKNFDSGDITDRELVLDFGVGGNDTVRYKPANLTPNPDSLAAGITRYQGASIDYTFGDTATYINDGCKIPLQTVGASITGSTVTASAGSSCGGDTITLIGVSKNATNKQWTNTSGDTGAFEPGTDSKDTAIYITKNPTSQSLVFKYSVIDQCGTTDEATATVSLSSIYPTVSTPNIITNDVCANEIITLTTTSTAANLKWTADNNATIENSTTNNASLSTDVNTPSSIVFTLTASSRCANLGTATANKTVNINPIPTVTTTTGTDVKICPGKDSVLVASGATTYEWKDATSIKTGSTLKVPAATNTINLVGTTSGCKDSITIVTSAKTSCKKSQIIINSQDTLNSNTSTNPVIYLQAEKAENKVVTFTLLDITSFSILVIDRWGTQVYENTDLTLKFWDGKNNKGTLLTPGTYFYVIKGTGGDNIQHNYKGYITIIGN